MQISFHPSISFLTPQKSQFKKSYGLQADTFCKSAEVNFVGRHNTNDLQFMRTLKGLDCPCCGNKMMSCDDLNELNPKIVKGPSQKAFEYLDQYKECLRDKERQYYDYLEGLSKQHPEKDIKSLMMSVRDEHSKNNKDRRIEHPMDNLDDFIVFYTRRAQKDFSALQIMKQLFAPSKATVEHIHPWSDGGADKVENIILECADCNGERGDMPLDEFIETRHPEMKQNIHKHLKQIQEKVDNGEFKKYPTYLEDVKETLTEESNGILCFEQKIMLSNFLQAG